MRVGVAVRHQPGERPAAGHAIAARVVDDDEVDAAGFFELGADAGAGAAADDRLAAFDALSQAGQNFVTREDHAIPY